MKKVVCYINSAGLNVNFLNFKDTVKSISEKINIEFDFFITTDTLENKENFENIFNKLNIKNIKDIRVNNLSWASNFNNFFLDFSENYEYILCSHDDLIVRTFDFFNITIEQIKNFEDSIGWIGFTSDSYYRINNKIISQSAREFFCKDRNKFPRVFELHDMGKVFDSKKLDLPKKVCKVPGIYSHFNLIKSENLRKIGLCEDWGKYTLLIDEDWSVKTLINNMWTVWIPNVFYDHPLRYDERKIKGIQYDNDNVSQKFLNKWGYDCSHISDETIKKVCDNFKGTNIDFFNNKNTFDYQYFD